LAILHDDVRPLRSEQELLEEFHRTRDPDIREEIMRRYLRFAHSMANRYAGKGEPGDDLFQVACLGVLHAIDRFDPDRGRPFVAFAAPTVLGELRRHLRDKVWTLRLPRALQDRTRQVEQTIENLSVKSGHAPTVDEIAVALGLSDEQVLEAFEAAGQRRVGSLDAPVASEDAGAETLGARIGTLDDGFEKVDDMSTVDTLLPLLSDEEREVLRMRFVDQLTQSEIGERIGHSQMHVSRMLRDILQRMRDRYAATATAA
jgi:RNA polymerase sigma-B factor